MLFPVGSIVPLIMLTVILSAHEYTDPQFRMIPSAPLRGRNALVVSGNRGIGLAVAKEFVKRGATVLVTYRNGAPDAVLAAFAAANADNGGAYAGSLALDLDDWESTSTFVQRLQAQFPSFRAFHTLVLNSGIMCGNSTARGVDDTLITNVVGPVYLAERLLPLMGAEGATVLFTSSPSARAWNGAFADLLDWSGDPKHVTVAEMVCHQKYSRSKLLLDVAVMELAQQHGTAARFYSVYPGPTRTDMLENVLMHLATTLYSDWVAHSKAFHAFFNIWATVLMREPATVALQYSFAAWQNGTLARNGCSFYADECLRALASEQVVLEHGGVLTKVRALAR